MFHHPDLTHQLVRDRHDQLRRELRPETGATRLRILRPREHERHHTRHRAHPGR